MNGKGDKPRPRKTSRQEYDLRWAYASGKMTFEEFERKYKALHSKGLIYRR